MPGTQLRLTTSHLLNSRNLKLFLLLIFVICAQACTVAQKKQPSPNNSDYNGSIIQANRIQVPNYKSVQKGINWPTINAIILSQTDFDSAYSDELISLINDSLKNNKAGKTCDLIIKELRSGNTQLKDFQKRAYYQLEFKNNQLILSAYAREGLINGLASLDFELQNGSSTVKIVRDWPSIERRIKQVYLKSMDPEIVKQVLHRLWRGHYNGALYTIHNSVKFEAIIPYCLKDAMSVDDFKAVCDYGRLFNLEPIPHFNFLSHQNTELVQESISPELLYNSRTIDPRNSKVYDLIYASIDECIASISPKSMHIGFDEVVGHTPKQIAQYGPILPPELYLQHLKKINNYLHSKQVETWIWGDMLLHAADFPKMHPGALNGPSSYRWLIDSVPKNILICDWHYKDYKYKLSQKIEFPSVDYFLAKGFTTLGASFNGNQVTTQFSNYLVEKNEKNFNGMIATSWHKLLRGTTKYPKNNDKMEEFDAILEHSANAFWNATAP